MKAWKWECLSSYLSTSTVSECGPLHGPIHEFKLLRDEDLKLILETVSNIESSSNAKSVLTGTVRLTTEQVCFKGYAGDTAVARGVVPYNVSHSHGADPSDSLKTERSQVHAMEWKAAGDQEVAYAVQWLENMPDQFVWPHSIDRKITETNTLIYRGDSLDIEFNDSFDSGGFSRCCVQLSIEGLDLFVVKAHELEIENIRSPGYVIYKGRPSDETQSKVKDILSFFLGQFLVDLGFTYFDQHWRPVYFKARSAHTMHGAAFKLITLPPTLLSSRSYNEIDRSILEHMMMSLWDVYDQFDLRGVLWAYWHAAAAPAHIAAVHYGAAIESLQRRYAEQLETHFKTTLLEASSWKILSAKIEELVSGLQIDSTTKQLLTRKIQSLNLAPQSTVMERFLTELGIKGGAVELSAWNKRNRAAHGSKIPEDKFIEVIRENKALMILLNRILLAISHASQQYCNYYTPGHPVSALASPIPAED